MTSRIDATTAQRLQRLRALAERGIGGEQENAQRVLEAMLKKLGYTVEQYLALADDGASRTFVNFPCRSGAESDLMLQVILMVTGKRNIYRGTQRGCLAADVSPREKADIQTLYSIYVKAWRTAQEELLLAFVLRHGIHSKEEREKDDNAAPIEKDKIARIVSLAGGLEDVQTQRRIAGSR